jgi:methionyl-tRNA synthetase
LANGLGNFVSRVLTLATKIRISQENNFLFGSLLRKTWQDYRKALENFNFDQALALIWELISFCDKYIDKEKPWEKTSINREILIKNLLNVLGNIAFLLSPFLPSTSKKIFQQLGIDEKSQEAWRFRVKKQDILFPRLSGS